MPRISPDIETFARIKVIGVGNSGTNSVNHMVRSKVRGVEFVAVDTDAQKLHHSLASKKIHIGKDLTRGLGGGMNPEIGRMAAEQTKDVLEEIVKGADMIFIACGFGGGTATGAAPVVAKIAKEHQILTIAVVTKPFGFEGTHRSRIADDGLANLKNNVDAMIIVPNDRLLGLIDEKTTFLSAFKMCDEVLRQAVEGISDLITMPGIINVDFADVKAIMQNAGSALMGIGRAQGENRAEEAAKRAINSPLLDLSIEGAKGVLFVVSGKEDMAMQEIQSAANIITESIDPEARVIFGAVNDDRLRKNEMMVTVIASSFNEIKLPRKASLAQIFSNEQEKKEDKENEDEESSVPAFLRRNKK